MTTTRELLGLRIKELRKIGQLTQEQLSEKINIDPKHLSRIEVGKSYPSLDTLENLSTALEVEIKDFFEFMHKKKDMSEIIKNINSLLKKADKEKVQLVLKVVRAIVL